MEVSTKDDIRSIFGDESIILKVQIYGAVTSLWVGTEVGCDFAKSPREAAAPRARAFAM